MATKKRRDIDIVNLIKAGYNVKNGEDNQIFVDLLGPKDSLYFGNKWKIECNHMKQKGSY